MYERQHSRGEYGRDTTNNKTRTIDTYTHTSIGRKNGIPSYAIANSLLDTTEAVAVDGAMLLDTLHWYSCLATTARQCCILLARA